MPRFLSRGALLLGLGVLACEGEPRDFLPGPSNPGSGIARLALRLGSSGADEVVALAVDASGAVFVTGTFSGSVDFDPSTRLAVVSSLGSTDIFVAKYGPTHAFEWVARIGSTGQEASRAIVLDPGGDVVIAGWFTGIPDFDPGATVFNLTSAGGRDGFVARLSPEGTFRWARRFGGASDDHLSSVALDGSTILIAGDFQGAVDGLPTGWGPVAAPGLGVDAVLLLMGSDGAAGPALPFGGSGEDRATSVAAAAGVVFVGGTFNTSVDFDPGPLPNSLTSVGAADAFLASFTVDGRFRWVGAFGGTTEDQISRNGLSTTDDGSLLVAGWFTGSVDLDPGPGLATAETKGQEDLFVLRFDAFGTLVEGFTLGGTGRDIALRAVEDATGELAVIGTFTASLDFDPGPGSSAITPLGSGGATDAFVARYDVTGALRWARRFGDVLVGESSLTTPFGLAFDSSGRTVVSGRFFGNMDVDPGVGTRVLSSLGGADGFLLRLTAAGDLATSQ